MQSLFAFQLEAIVPQIEQILICLKENYFRNEIILIMRNWIFMRSSSTGRQCCYKLVATLIGFESSRIFLYLHSQLILVRISHQVSFLWFMKMLLYFLNRNYCSMSLVQRKIFCPNMTREIGSLYLCLLI